MKKKGEREWKKNDPNFSGELPEIENYKNWPNKPMPEIVSPAKGRMALRKRKNTHRMSSSSSGSASEGSSPTKKPASKVTKISRFFEKVNNEQEKES